MTRNLRPILSPASGLPVVSTLIVAEHFGKEHKNVLRLVESIIPEIGPELCQLNFEPTSVQVHMPKGGVRDVPAYHLTRDGFTLLAMGFTGKKALAWKVRYIQAFNAMEAELRGQAAPEPEQYDLPNQPFFTFKEVSAIMGLSAKHLRNWLALHPELPVHQQRRHCRVLIARTDLLAWIKQSRRVGQPAPQPVQPQPQRVALPDPELDPCIHAFATVMWNFGDMEKASQLLLESVNAKFEANGRGRSLIMRYLGQLKTALFSSLDGNIQAIHALANVAFALERKFIPRP